MINLAFFFPQLCTYSHLIKRFKYLGPVMKQLSRSIIPLNSDSLKIVDSIPIPLLLGQRAYRSMVVKICQRYRIKPDWGYCAAKKMYYFGFKLMAIIEGEQILGYTLVPASTSEQRALMTLVERENLFHLQLFGDKGFQMNAEDKCLLEQRNISIEAIPRANMKKVVIDDLNLKKRLRKRIETNFSQLVSLFDLTKFLLRTIFGFASSIIRTVLAYNFSCWLKSS